MFKKKNGLLKLVSEAFFFNEENGIRKQPVNFRVSVANFFFFFPGRISEIKYSVAINVKLGNLIIIEKSQPLIRFGFCPRVMAFLSFSPEQQHYTSPSFLKIHITDKQTTNRSDRVIVMLA